jgi:hypothetical protein
MQLLAVRAAQILNMTALATDLGVSVPTVKRWLSVLEAGRIVFLLPPYFNNLGKRITKAPKVYFLDTGLLCHMAGIRDREHLLEGPMAGALFENYCVQETIRAFTCAARTPRVSYLRTNNGLEVDLLLEGQRPLPVEIKLSRTPSASLVAGLSRFASLFEVLSPEPGLLLCLADGERAISRGVTAVGLHIYLDRLRQRIAQS